VVKSFIIALQFLSRIPTPQLKSISDKEIGRSLIFYPLVGLIISTLLIGLLYLSSALAINIQAAIILIAWVLITGGLHLDGLADSADAWIGGQNDKNKTLDIMKDPRCGPAAVSSLIVVLILKFSLLQEVVNDDNWQYILIAIIVARASIILLFQTTAYVRLGGLGESLANHHSASLGWLLLCLLSILLVWFFHWQGIILLIVIGLLFLSLRFLMIKRLGGTTGDTAGALCELMEVGTLLTLIILQIE